MKKLIIPSALILATLIAISCGTSGPSGPGPGPSLPSNTWTPNFTATITMTFSTIVPTFTASRTYTATPCTLCPDSYEPDNAYAQAKQISGGQSQPRTLHVWDDEDWFYFIMAYRGTIDMSITGFPTDGGSDDCPYLEVCTDPADMTGTSVFSFGYNSNSVTSYILDPGTYYGKIRLANYDLPGNYTLSLSVTYDATETPVETDTEIPTDTPEPPTPTPTKTATPSLDAYEPDDTYTQADEITGDEPNHTISSENEVDWFKITVPSGTISSIWMQAQAPAASNGTHLYFYDAAGAATGTYIQDYYGNPNTPLIYRVLSEGTYYFKFAYDGTDVITYDIDFMRADATFTPTSTVTVTPTFSPTATITYQADTYEEDDTPLAAKSIAKGETQTRSICPQADDDFAKYLTSKDEIITASAWGESNTYYVLDFVFNTVEPYMAGFTREESTGGNEIVVYDSPLPVTLYVRVRGDISHTYYLSLTSVFMTPTSTGTATPTNTASPTITVSPTVTPTYSAWSAHAFSSETNCSNPSLASSGGVPAFGHMRPGGYMYVNDTQRVFSADASKIGQKWLAVSSSYEYVVYPDIIDGYIKLRSSSNWTLPSSTGAKGSQPCLFLNGDTPYIAYADSDAGNSICVRTYSSGWSYCGSAHFTNPAAVGGYNSLAIGGFNDGTLKLYVAYADASDGNRIKVKWKNGAADWADLGSGTAVNQSSSSVDISAIDGSNVYLMYSGASIVPNVIKWNGTSWVDLSMPYASQGRYNSVFAAGYNEVYASYINMSTTKAVVRKYNGTGWQALNSTDGYTPAGAAYTSILMSAGILYSGYVDASGYMSVYKYQ